MSNALIKPETPKTIAEMQSLGEVFVKSRFFQDSQDAAQAIVKVMAGAELGFPPIASMTGVYIVKGKVSLSANLIAAAIKRSGRYTYRVRKLDDSGCVIEFFENGESIGESSFAREDAQRAQLLGKETWRSFFRNMAFARALSNGAKWHCPDVFGGPVYTPEELGAETDGEGELINVTPEPETKKPLALVPPVQAEKAPEQFEQDHRDMDTYIAAAWKAAGREQILDAWKAQNNYGAKPLQWKREQLDTLNEEARQKVKAKAAIADPLPETQNTENERIEQERIALIDEMKTTWLTASSESDWDVFTGKYDLYGMSIKDLKGTLNKIKEKAAAILATKSKDSKSNEPASGYAAQRQDGARKVLRKNESGEIEAQWEKPVEAEPEKKSKLKAVVDEVIAEHWPNTPEGYNEGYKATRAKMESLIGEFRNFDDINAADQAKLIAALGRWNPADDKPKGKGKK